MTNNNTKEQIRGFLRSPSGKLVSALIYMIKSLIVNKKIAQKSATGAVLFSTCDYCPYSDSCLSFLPHSRGKSGRKGVQSHLRKVHADEIYYLIPCQS